MSKMRNSSASRKIVQWAVHEQNPGADRTGWVAFRLGIICSFDTLRLRGEPVKPLINGVYYGLNQ